MLTVLQKGKLNSMEFPVHLFATRAHPGAHFSLLFGITDAAALQAIFHSTYLLVGTFCLAKGGKLYEVRKTLHWSP